jgi:hypothetical protein
MDTDEVACPEKLAFSEWVLNRVSANQALSSTSVPGTVWPDFVDEFEREKSKSDIATVRSSSPMDVPCPARKIPPPDCGPPFEELLFARERLEWKLATLQRQYCILRYRKGSPAELANVQFDLMMSKGYQKKMNIMVDQVLKTGLCLSAEEMERKLGVSLCDDFLPPVIPEADTDRRVDGSLLPRFVESEV